MAGTHQQNKLRGRKYEKTIANIFGGKKIGILGGNGG